MALSKEQLIAIADQAAASEGIDPSIFRSQIGAESGWRVDARSPAGALGVAQFMPATAKGMGVDPLNPRSALYGAAKYMRRNLDQFGGDYALALAAYNAGGGNARKALKSFPETKAYVAKILAGKGNPVSGPQIKPESPQIGLQAASKPFQAAIPAGLAERRPRLSKLLGESNRLLGLSQAAPELGTVAQQPAAPVAAEPPKDGEPGWRYLQRIGQERFGLKNDAGNSQTFGGGHTKGSEHYDNRAIDFGTAKNKVATLRKAEKWYKSQGYDTLWEGDHLHVSLPGSGT